MTDDASGRRYQLILPRSSTAPRDELLYPTPGQMLDAGPRTATSSQRGRKFRERRRQHMEELEQQVGRLQQQVARAETARVIAHEKALRRRHSASNSSLIRLVREYYTLFQYGFRDAPTYPSDPNGHNSEYKECFLRSIMSEDIVTGDLVGIEAALMQWRFFTFTNANLRVEIKHVDIHGPEEDPSVEISSVMHFITQPTTLILTFPGAEADPELMEKFSSVHLAVPVLTRFQFTPEGTISYEEVNADIISGYRDAGFSLTDISKLMKYSAISAKSTMHRDTILDSNADESIVEAIVRVTDGGIAASCGGIDGIHRQ
ncbi:hypothetical protein Poli38472_011273 [Pythium oligandrum]|uniref:BZIP domain-containing protein n=1 Tax=Pythium oligandrum TaxID=41045 RepID=A0A8K1CRI2_PYTOL|nr:hypothetical protein Poli38472_011273 [Pythium oligandrum]|eukprot:TMW67653.1 hypothetical protein Poli38472_011273 [Pythium oligandrum]